jgi:hypothetical protein
MASNSFHQYGSIIDSGVDVTRVNLYNTFVNYFENPKMRRIKDLQGGLYVLFGCQIETLLVREQRYLLVAVPSQKVKSPEGYLEDLEWITFETRSLFEELDVPIHSYSRKELNNIITLISKSDSEYNYTCTDFDIIVRLLTTKNQIRPYNNRGTLGLALETYSTICAI